MKEPWPYPRIFAHRGGGSLAPENTLAAIRTGQDLGFAAHEFDLKYLIRAVTSSKAYQLSSAGGSPSSDAYRLFDRMAVRGGIIIGRTNNSRQVSALRQGKLPHVLAKISNTRFGEAANSKTSAIAQIHFVGVQLENLLL